MSSISALTSNMDADFYLDLLMAQLKNQDPTEPLSNSDMVNQMAQLTTVETMTQLNANFSDMLKFQQLLGGTQLLGRQVEYLRGEQTVSGTAQAVTSRTGGIKVIVDEQEVALDDIQRIL